MEDDLKALHKVLAESFSEEEFVKAFNSLTMTDQTGFEHAVLMYKRAMKCKKCDSDVCLALLCSSVDAIWSQRIKKSHERFKKFLMEYCPKKLRNPPLLFYKTLNIPEDYKEHQSLDELRAQLKVEQPRKDNFEDAIDFVYERFRCYFFHEAIGLVGVSQEDDSLEGGIDASISPRFDSGFKKSPSIPVRIDLRIVEWFSNVVRESFVRYIRKKPFRHSFQQFTSNV